ncbi:MAG: hypothetical protein PHE61_03030 [Candidatus Omnitrophica bacterium]|nr:hypothetical protein [Candidatus Omnitrophota bacterium]
MKKNSILSFILIIVFFVLLGSFALAQTREPQNTALIDEIHSIQKSVERIQAQAAAIQAAQAEIKAEIANLKIWIHRR